MNLLNQVNPMAYKRSWIYAPVGVVLIRAAYLTNNPQMVTAGLATLGCGLADCLGYLESCNRSNAVVAELWYACLISSTAVDLRQRPT